MTGGYSHAASHGIDRLFGEGTVAGMTDAELLGRFVDRRDEVAISALVARHGPLVLGVCRGVLKDENDAHDAFQATFLVLVRKARSLRVERSLSSWLCRVSYRIAVHASRDARRRQARERQGAEMRANQVVGPSDPDHYALILEEVDHLPERYRVPIVLCGLEGMTHEVAAQHLGWPIGTVSGRLFRARKLLQARLTRRGVTLPSVLFISAMAPATAHAAVSPALIASTVEAAMTGLANGAISFSIARLADWAIRSMLMTRIKVTAAALLVMGITAIGIGATAQQIGRPPQAPPGPHASKPGIAHGAGPIDTPARNVLQEAYKIVTADTGEPNVFTLIAIAKAQAKLDDRAAALMTLEHATQVADKLKPKDRAVALGAIVYAHWEAGDRKLIPEILRRALDDVERVDDESQKLGVLMGVGKAQAWTGDIPAARETIGRMRGIVLTSPQANLLPEQMGVVGLQTIVGDYDDALGLVDSVASDFEKITLLTPIADAAGLANHYFLQPPRELTPAQKEVRLRVLHQILEKYPDPPVAVAIALGDLGETDEALKLAQPSHDADVQRRRGDATAMPWILMRIGMAQAKAGHPDDAKKTFRKALDLIQAHPELKFRLEQVAYGQAVSGDVEGALRTAKAIEPAERARTLITIAEEQAKTGAPEDSKETLRRALEDARTCLAHPPEGKPGTLGARAEFWKSRARLDIATIESRLGNFTEALQAASEMPTNRDVPGYQKGQALTAIAKEQARSGHSEEALAWISKLDRAEDKASALRGLAEGLAAQTRTANPAPAPQ